MKDPERILAETVPGELQWRGKEQIAGQYHACRHCGQKLFLPVSKMKKEGE